MKIMDCTLRDGANVVGNGFSPELTKMMIEGLLRSNIRIIEMGNAKGPGRHREGLPRPHQRRGLPGPDPPLSGPGGDRHVLKRQAV